MTTQNTLPESIKKRINDEADSHVEQVKKSLDGSSIDMEYYHDGIKIGYTAAAEQILTNPGAWGMPDKKKIETDLLWELIQDWQDARDSNDEEYLSKERFSFSDIEVDLYDWLKKADERESAPPSLPQQELVDRVQQLEQAAEILEELCHLKDYKDSEGKDAYYTEEQPKLWAKAKEFLKQYKQWDKEQVRQSVQ
jgi:hypothetical protein